MKRMAVGMAVAIAAAGAAWAQGVKAGGEYYVHFTNGRVMRVHSTYPEGAWTLLMLDAKNRFSVPSQTIARVERIAPFAKGGVPVSRANIVNEQPEPAEGYEPPPPVYEEPLPPEEKSGEEPAQEKKLLERPAGIENTMRRLKDHVRPYSSSGTSKPYETP